MHEPTEEQRRAVEEIRRELGGRSDLDRELSKVRAADALRDAFRGDE